MSTKETNNNGAVAAEGAASGEGSGIPEADIRFLITCLQNTTAGNIAIDVMTVATLLNYKNHRSVSNRIAALKKKYNLPIGVSTSKAIEESGDTPQKNGNEASSLAGPGDAKVPKTPSKQRVTKPRASTGGKKSPAKPRSKSKANEDDKEEKLNVKQADGMNESQGEDAPMTKEKRAAEDKKLFGTSGSDHESESDADEV